MSERKLNHMMQDSSTPENTTEQQPPLSQTAASDSPDTLSEQDELHALTETLAAILSSLSKGEALPADVQRRADALWTVIDRHPAAGNEPIAYPLEGEGNLLRKILYAIEHNQPLDRDTLERADAWIEQSRAREQH